VGGPFDLERFVAAQDAVYGRVVAELRCGRKETHWMWFVFPQIRGLGHSAMAVKFAISGAAEARAYLAHPVLAPRLVECTNVVLQTEGRSIEEIFGAPDDLKFRSSMTLFDIVAPGTVFGAALRRFFAGQGDPATLAALS
jgi:uncharacterized protein (DUF1810 family)